MAIEINVSKQFGIYYIPVKNTDVWNRVDTYLSEFGNEEVILDFKDVQLEEPYKNMDFHNIIRRENVKFRIYNYSALVEGIDMACRLCGVATGRVENVGIVAEEQKSPDKNIDVSPRIVSKLLEVMEVNGDTLTVWYSKALSGLSRASAVNSLEAAIETYLAGVDVKINRIVVDLENIVVQKSTIKYLVELVEKFKKSYADFELANLIGREDFDMHLAIKNGLAKGMETEEKLQIMKKELKKNTVGLLIMYENKRGGKDRYGRVGNGEILWCRYAILESIVNRANVPTAVFKVYHKDDFHTSFHKTIENIDSTELKHDTIEIEIEKLGFFDYFLGSEFHFNLPIQFELEGSRNEWIEVEPGKTGLRKLTIPELAMHVLDEHNVEYNKQELEKAIEWTNEVLHKADADKK